jgi:hypothetical protein
MAWKAAASRHCASQTEEAVGYLVKRVQQALRRRCDAALKPTGLSMAQYALLRALADHPEASAAELARRCAQRLGAADDAVFGVESAMLQGIPPAVRRCVADALARFAENLESG